MLLCYHEKLVSGFIYWGIFTTQGSVFTIFIDAPAIFQWSEKFEMFHFDCWQVIWE